MEVGLICSLGPYECHTMTCYTKNTTGQRHTYYVAGPFHRYTKTRAICRRDISFSHQYSIQSCIKLIRNLTTRDVTVNSKWLFPCHLGRWVVWHGRPHVHLPRQNVTPGKTNLSKLRVILLMSNLFFIHLLLLPSSPFNHTLGSTTCSPILHWEMLIEAFLKCFCSKQQKKKGNISNVHQWESGWINGIIYNGQNEQFFFQVQSLSPETKHSKWESTQRNC